jgi:predicted amidohydrolase
MPKSNVDFWAAKFAENIERDRRVQERLARMGWRVLVVWECELTGYRTLETIRNVAHWLTGNDTADSGETIYVESLIERKTLLESAENKVRYRIASYQKKKQFGDS